MGQGKDGDERSMCHQASDFVGDWGSVPRGALGLLGGWGTSPQGSPLRVRELGTSSPTPTTSEGPAQSNNSQHFLACCMVSREASRSQRKPQVAGHRCFQLEVRPTWREIGIAEEMWVGWHL